MDEKRTPSPELIREAGFWAATHHANAAKIYYGAVIDGDEESDARHHLKELLRFAALAEISATFFVKQATSDYQGKPEPAQEWLLRLLADIGHS